MGKRILFINQETTPYVPKTELSSMGNLMPHKMQEAGFEIRTFMPKWGHINERRGQLHEVIRLSGMNLIIDETDHPLIIKVASIPQSRIQVYFIDNEDYFQRKGMTKDDDGKDYADNGERAIFFARGVLETVKKLRWAPDIIHCQGWMSSVIPFYVKTAYKNEPQFANTHIITTLFEEQPMGKLGDNFKDSLEFRPELKSFIDKYNDCFNSVELAKLAIDFSDGIVRTNCKDDDKLSDYILKSEKPCLQHPSDSNEIGELYKNFYSRFID